MKERDTILGLFLIFVIAMVLLYALESKGEQGPCADEGVLTGDIKFRLWLDSTLYSAEEQEQVWDHIIAVLEKRPAPETNMPKARLADALGAYLRFGDD